MQLSRVYPKQKRVLFSCAVHDALLPDSLVEMQVEIYLSVQLSILQISVLKIEPARPRDGVQGSVMPMHVIKLAGSKDVTDAKN